MMEIPQATELKARDQQWYESLSDEERSLFMSDGLSDYDLRVLDRIVAGHGDWFHAQLVRLFLKADQKNWQRLGDAFPGTALACESRRAFP